MEIMRERERESEREREREKRERERERVCVLDKSNQRVFIKLYIFSNVT